MTSEPHEQPTPESSRESSFGMNAEQLERPSDDGISLDELSESFARLISAGDDPYRAPLVLSDRETPVVEGEEVASNLPSALDQDDPCPITPRSILEAMLFVGHPQNEPLTSKRVASLMRGVRAEEIDELIVELNALYAHNGCPYVIESVGAGYRMTLRPEYDSLRGAFQRRVKEARLSQPAIDVLAVVAYRQPISRREIEKIREKPCSSLLNLLVRRQLLGVERRAGSRVLIYRTTERFLEQFQLESLADLPQGPETEFDLPE